MILYTKMPHWGVLIYDDIIIVHEIEMELQICI